MDIYQEINDHARLFTAHVETFLLDHHMEQAADFIEDHPEYRESLRKMFVGAIERYTRWVDPSLFDTPIR